MGQSAALALTSSAARKLVKAFIKFREVARIDRSARSLMPDGIEAGLTPQDMADLLEFLGAK